MLRRTTLRALKHRPKTVSIEPGSNRFLEAPILAKSKELFSPQEYPNKRVIHNWRFFIKAGKAATGPPVGQEFSKLGLKVMDFTKAFNDRTKPQFKDDVELTVRIQVYFDKSYTYRIEPPPTTWFLLRAIRKKRREAAPVAIRGHYTAYLTLEMIYEIAKMKQFHWERFDYPPIEDRVRRIAGQARRMGICLLGVDTPPSPIKGMTEKQYEAECAKYREIHMKLYNAMKDKELAEAPLIERVHRPDLSPLPKNVLEKGLVDPKLFAAMWQASQPDNAYNKNRKDREAALKYVQSLSWFKDMTAEEMKLVFFNWRLTETEKQRQLTPSYEEQSYWTREAPGAAPGGGGSAPK
jgi:ribosomal protein L11